jgi:hypothetical protein
VGLFVITHGWHGSANWNSCHSSFEIVFDGILTLPGRAAGYSESD